MLTMRMTEEQAQLLKRLVLAKTKEVAAWITATGDNRRDKELEKLMALLKVVGTPEREL